MRADQEGLQRFMVFIQRLWGSGDSSGRLPHAAAKGAPSVPCFMFALLIFTAPMDGSPPPLIQ
jgi:hypothetical protein